MTLEKDNRIGIIGFPGDISSDRRIKDFREIIPEMTLIFIFIPLQSCIHCSVKFISSLL
jgi:hypothetical protein